MPQLDRRVSSPEVIVTDDIPMITAVPLPLIIPIARHLLVSRQGRGEVVRVQVLLGRYVLQPYHGVALYRCTVIVIKKVYKTTVAIINRCIGKELLLFSQYMYLFFYFQRKRKIRN